MEQKGELVSFRPDIKVVDCTLRDGGLVNNFENISGMQELISALSILLFISNSPVT